MVDAVVCDLDSWCSGLTTSNIRSADYCGGPSNGSMGMVLRLHHGFHNCKLGQVKEDNPQATLMLTFAVAELVSAYPTAGGMYFVTRHVVPEKSVPIWSWVIGWCNFLGQACGVASIAYTIGQMLLAAVSMNTNFSNGTYSYSP